MWWEFYTICYKEMMMQKQSGLNLKIYRIENAKTIGLEIKNMSD